MKNEEYSGRIRLIATEHTPHEKSSRQRYKVTDRTEFQTSSMAEHYAPGSCESNDRTGPRQVVWSADGRKPPSE